MADYLTSNIRNIALMGHGGEGKTTLTEAMLFAAGIIDRQGKVEDGSTVTDFEPEEIKRKCSISAACAPIDWNDKMLNVIDVPGYFDFIGEMTGPLRVVETVGIVVSGVTGFNVGAEKAFKHAVKSGVGRMFIINQMDRDMRTLTRLPSSSASVTAAASSRSCCPSAKARTSRALSTSSRRRRTKALTRS